MQRVTLCVLALVGMATGPGSVIAQDACAPQRLVSPPETPPVKFGFSTATNGRFWFVGDRAARTYCSGTSLGCQAGAVHVYELIDGRLERVQTIVPSDVASGANFGASLAVDGDRLVVGAYQSRWPDGLTRGAVYVYEFDGERWEEADRIAAPADITVGFGTGVLLRGDDLLVWPNHSRDRVYSYRLERGAWTLAQTIWPEASEFNWGFGRRMALDDRWLIIGAPMDGTVAVTGGSVYVFERQPDGSFAFFQKLAADAIARLGWDVALHGEQLLASAPVASDAYPYQGEIRVYRLRDGSWMPDGVLRHSQPQEDAAFGVTLEIENGVLLVATGQELGPRGRGTVYEFHEGPDGVWREVRRLDPNPVLYITRGYGASMTLHGRHALVGSTEDRHPDTSDYGAAYFFDLACIACTPDIDADGALTVFDFLTFLNRFQDADPLADFDGDGEFTIFDFLAFQTAFDAGCP